MWRARWATGPFWCTATPARTTPGRLQGGVRSGRALRGPCDRPACRASASRRRCSATPAVAMDSLYRTYEAAVKAERGRGLGGVPRAQQAARASRSEWRVDRRLRRRGPRRPQARYADLVVVGQRDPEAPSRWQRLPTWPRSVALGSRTAAAGGAAISALAKPPGRTVMLCWNASREAARAAIGALPLLENGRPGDRADRRPARSAARGRSEPGADVARGSAGTASR